MLCSKIRLKEQKPLNQQKICQTSVASDNTTNSTINSEVQDQNHTI
jgi:hypothetical protein